MRAGGQTAQALPRMNQLTRQGCGKRITSEIIKFGFYRLNNYLRDILRAHSLLSDHKGVL